MRFLLVSPLGYAFQNIIFGWVAFSSFGVIASIRLGCNYFGITAFLSPEPD
jgi:hypothetical protein